MRQTPTGDANAAAPANPRAANGGGKQVRPKSGGSVPPPSAARGPNPPAPASPMKVPAAPRKRQPTLGPGNSTASPVGNVAPAKKAPAGPSALPAGPRRRQPTIPQQKQVLADSDPEMEPIPLTTDVIGQRIGGGGGKRGPQFAPGHTGTNLALAFAGTAKFKMGEEIFRDEWEVLQAVEDLSLRRSLVVKTMAEPTDVDAQAKFIEEAQINGQLQHPNIVSVYELGVNQMGHPYMAMARVHGMPLADVIADAHHDEDTSALGLARRERFMLEVFLKICDAMSFAHSRGIIHRDLTPDAVFVGDYGDVLVSNWHVAKPLSKDEQAIEERVMSDRRGLGGPLTVEGTVIGTLPYMSPEQAAGRISQLDEGTDIYALGAILYQMLTNSPPYEGDRDDEILADVLEGNLVPPSQRVSDGSVPEELEGIILKAMAHRRAMRFKTVQEFREAIEEYLAGRGLNTANATVGVLLKRWASTHKPALILALILLLTVTIAPAAVLFSMYSGAAAEAEKLQELVDDLKPAND